MVKKFFMKIPAKKLLKFLFLHRIPSFCVEFLNSASIFCILCQISHNEIWWVFLRFFVFFSLKFSIHSNYSVNQLNFLKEFLTAERERCHNFPSGLRQVLELRCYYCYQKWIFIDAIWDRKIHEMQCHLLKIQSHGWPGSCPTETEAPKESGQRTGRQKSLIRSQLPKSLLVHPRGKGCQSVKRNLPLECTLFLLAGW